MDYVSNNRVKNVQLQDIERTKISADLHDSAIQTLTGMVHKAEFALRLADVDIIQMKLEFVSIIKDLKETISSLREMVFNLRAPSLNDFSLLDAISDYCTYKNKNNAVEIIIKSQGDELNTSKAVKSTLYRICQESFTNFLKHSEAKKCEINLNYSDTDVFFSVSDDGTGFDFSILTNTNIKTNNFGLLIMKERTELLGGKFELCSGKFGGTEIRVTVSKSGGGYDYCLTR